MLQRALRLPGGVNPRARELAQSLRANAATDRDVVHSTLAIFRAQPFFYTLVPPELGKHSVDEFLFQTRRGFCEHYASSFVFLMRAAGIPARVVTGYQGGEINPLGDYMIVRQSEAHAWAEVWLEGRVGREWIPRRPCRPRASRSASARRCRGAIRCRSAVRIDFRLVTHLRSRDRQRHQLLESVGAGIHRRASAAPHGAARSGRTDLAHPRQCC